MTPAIVGIDNGVSGALCALCPESGILLAHTLMPVREHYGKKEPDPLGLIRWLSGFDCILIGLEEPLKFAASSQAMRSMSICFGLCHGALETAGLPVARVEVHHWQSAMLGKKRPAGQTKQMALRKAQELWPDERFLPGARCSTPHDGIVDAALIARYLRDWKNN